MEAVQVIRLFKMYLHISKIAVTFAIIVVMNGRSNELLLIIFEVFTLKSSKCKFRFAYE